MWVTRGGVGRVGVPRGAGWRTSTLGRRGAAAAGGRPRGHGQSYTPMRAARGAEGTTRQRQRREERGKRGQGATDLDGGNAGDRGEAGEDRGDLLAGDELRREGEGRGVAGRWGGGGVRGRGRAECSAAVGGCSAALGPGEGRGVGGWTGPRASKRRREKYTRTDRRSLWEPPGPGCGGGGAVGWRGELSAPPSEESATGKRSAKRAACSKILAPFGPVPRLRACGNRHPLTPPVQQAAEASVPPITTSCCHTRRTSGASGRGAMQRTSGHFQGPSGLMKSFTACGGRRATRRLKRDDKPYTQRSQACLIRGRARLEPADGVSLIRLEAPVVYLKATGSGGRGISVLVTFADIVMSYARTASMRLPTVARPVLPGSPKSFHVRTLPFFTSTCVGRTGLPIPRLLRRNRG